VYRATTITGLVFALLLAALGTLGVVYGLWSKVVVIQGVVETGDLEIIVERAYTDDDDGVDDPANDGGDTGLCADVGGVDAEPDAFAPKDVNADGLTSCDPAATGPDPKERYDKDVARCDASAEVSATGDASQQTAVLQITNAYPSYHCTAWIGTLVKGTIPVHIAGMLLEGAAVARCEDGRTFLDLVPSPTDDPALQDDISVCLSGFPAGVVQKHPGDAFEFDLDFHIEQGAPQGTPFSFEGVLCAFQFNEPSTLEECVNNPQAEGP
jgi:hypothetical protein